MALQSDVHLSIWSCEFESQTRQKLMCCELTLQVYSAHSVKLVLAVYSWGLHRKVGLKILGFVLIWLAVISDCTDARIENDTRHARQTVHTQISYMVTSPPSHTGDCMSYVRHVGHTATINKNHQWLLGLEYAKFSIHEKWNNCPHAYWTVSPERWNISDRRRIDLWVWPGI